MSASDYPELDGMPPGCTTTNPWHYEAIPVLVPYGPFDAFVVMQEPIVDGPVIFTQEEYYDVDSPPGVVWAEGGLGYQSEAEVSKLMELRGLASATANNTAFYNPAAKAAIVALATEAKERLNEIRDIYRYYEQDKMYRIEATGQSVYLPLSVLDDSVPDPVERTYRQAHRINIRDNYHAALHFLWCALYGKNQSASWRENKRLYDEMYGGDDGMGLATGPLPPTTGFPDFEFEPDEEPPPPPPGMVFEAPGTIDPDDEEEPDDDTGGYPGDDDTDDSSEYPDYVPPVRKKKKAAGGAGVAIAVIVVAALAFAKK